MTLTGGSFVAGTPASPVDGGPKRNGGGLGGKKETSHRGHESLRVPCPGSALSRLTLCLEPHLPKDALVRQVGLVSDWVRMSRTNSQSHGQVRPVWLSCLALSCLSVVCGLFRTTWRGEFQVSPSRCSPPFARLPPPPTDKGQVSVR